MHLALQGNSTDIRCLPHRACAPASCPLHAASLCPEGVLSGIQVVLEERANRPPAASGRVRQGGREERGAVRLRLVGLVGRPPIPEPKKASLPQTASAPGRRGRGPGREGRGGRAAPGLRRPGASLTAGFSSAQQFARPRRPLAVTTVTTVAAAVLQAAGSSAWPEPGLC